MCFLLGIWQLLRHMSRRVQMAMGMAAGSSQQEKGCREGVRPVTGTQGKQGGAFTANQTHSSAVMLQGSCCSQAGKASGQWLELIWEGR